MLFRSVEKDDRAYAQLQKNTLLALGRDHPTYRAFHYGVRQFCKKNNLKAYDVMIFDPPYDLVQTDHFDGITNHLAPDGIVVFSLPSTIEPLRLPGLKVIKQKTYGVAQLVYYKPE